LPGIQKITDSAPSHEKKPKKVQKTAWKGCKSARTAKGGSLSASLPGRKARKERGHPARIDWDRGHLARTDWDRGHPARIGWDRGHPARIDWDRGHPARIDWDRGHPARTDWDRGHPARQKLISAPNADAPKATPISCEKRV